MGKIRVAVLFGGKSAEHEVSIQSARNIASALNTSKYDVMLIGIDRDGVWYFNDDAKKLLDLPPFKTVNLKSIGEPSVLVSNSHSHELISQSGGKALGQVDVVFPVMHGPYGEDGTVQGLLKLADIPFVGAGVLGSAIGMDKDVMKRLLRDAGLPIANFVLFKDGKFDLDLVESKFPYPVFVKPVNMGSSVGVSKAKNREQLEKAIRSAFDYDRKVIVEEAIVGREVEVSVLGNENPKASIVGEIIPQHEFYSYDAKYLDENGALLKIPAEISDSVAKKIQELAVKAYDVLEIEGMTRVDLFLKSNGEAVINEINTIPGFTKISMYPKLWEASGLSYSELLDELIRLAVARHARESKIKNKFLE
ncbi:MAG: D-alanine--D-alanine ligase [Bdellovibrionales bacterium]|nr:D-alanine--D-alanine ligase [Bdellovibrionales bacterium]